MPYSDYELAQSGQAGFTPHGSDGGLYATGKSSRQTANSLVLISGLPAPGDCAIAGARSENGHGLRGINAKALLTGMVVR
jgi:hypothetical protein